MGRAAKNYILGKRLRRATNRRWSKEELEVIRTSVAADLSLDEVHRLLPHRTRDSVKDRYYRAREPQDRDEPASLNEARRQKDAREGSERLLRAMIQAGLVPAHCMRESA